MTASKILIVEDEAPIREMIAFHLNRAGYETLEAPDCRTAREMLVDEQPDLALIDWMLPDMSGLDIALERLDVADELVVMSGETVRNDGSMRTLAQESWSLAEIDERYESFVSRFRPLIAAYGKDANVSPKSAFLVRTLLIQEYRKVLLRDPQLPAELLPASWHGTAAYQLCRNLYQAVYAAADDYLTQTMETAEGPLPPAAAAFMQRFGGLA